jgi:hypothetical protein
MADVSLLGFRKDWAKGLISLKSGHHAITNKHTEAASVVQEVHKAPGDIENLAGCTLAKVGECSEWTTILNSAEENRTNVCKNLDGKPLLALSAVCTR